jgi:hypothetical protein
MATVLSVATATGPGPAVRFARLEFTTIIAWCPAIVDTQVKQQNLDLAALQAKVLSKAGQAGELGSLGLHDLVDAEQQPVSSMEVPSGSNSSARCGLRDACRVHSI